MLVIKYRKEGRARFISHLDMLKHMGKTLRRAGVKVEFSKGFNPHELIWFSPACVLGSISHCDYMAVTTDMESGEFFEKFSAVCLEGICPEKVWTTAKNPNLAGCVERAEYIMQMSSEDARKIADAFEKEEFFVTFAHKGEEKTQDIRQKMFSHCYNSESGEMTFVLASGNNTLRTDRLLGALSISGEPTRVALFANFGGELCRVDDMLDKLGI